MLRKLYNKIFKKKIIQTDDPFGNPVILSTYDRLENAVRGFNGFIERLDVEDSPQWRARMGFQINDIRNYVDLLEQEYELR